LKSGIKKSLLRRESKRVEIYRVEKTQNIRAIFRSRI